MERYFSPWFRWSDRTQYLGINLPGVYVIAISDRDISGESFSFRKEIVYVGMSNSVNGLKQRLKQFDLTIQFPDKPSQHGGADRFRYKHRNYRSLARKLFVSLRHFPCSPAEETPKNLRAMGKVVKAEYDCMALCIEKLRFLPEFNRKKDSVKLSHNRGRG
jgi:hypothetical protein